MHCMYVYIFIVYTLLYYACMYVCMHVCIGYVPSGSRPAQAVESKKGTPPISQVPPSLLFPSLASLPQFVRGCVMGLRLVWACSVESIFFVY